MSREDYADVAANLPEGTWASLFESLDDDTRAKLTAAMDNLKEVNDVKEVEVDTEDVSGSLQELNKKVYRLFQSPFTLYNYVSP